MREQWLRSKWTQNQELGRTAASVLADQESTERRHSRRQTLDARNIHCYISNPRQALPSQKTAMKGRPRLVKSKVKSETSIASYNQAAATKGGQRPLAA